MSALHNSMITLKDNPYQYRRRLPHYQKPGRALFVSFRKSTRTPLSDASRSVVLQRCLQGHNRMMDLHAAVIMPEHVHLLLTPLADLQGWPFPLRDILKRIKGASARNVNQLQGTEGPVWQEESFDHVLRSNESFEKTLEYIRQNPVRRGLVGTPEQYPWLWVNPDLRVGRTFLSAPEIEQKQTGSR
jgi:REP-associated tyrosine transposase